MGSSPSQGLISPFLGGLHYTPSCDLSMRQEDLGRCGRTDGSPRDALPCIHMGAGRMRGGFLCARNRCGLGCILVQLVGVEGALTEARIQLSSLRHQDKLSEFVSFVLKGSRSPNTFLHVIRQVRNITKSILLWFWVFMNFFFPI